MTDDCSQKKAQQAVCKLPGRYDFRVILSRIIQGADTYMPTPQPYSMPGRSAFDNRSEESV
jgi:hypothetical protein